jgi:PAS domain S-box-containing protein
VKASPRWLVAAIVLLCLAGPGHLVAASALAARQAAAASPPVAPPATGPPLAAPPAAAANPTSPGESQPDAWSRLQRTIVLGLLAIEVALLWIIYLRRVVAKRTTQLRSEVEQRRGAEERALESERRIRTIIEHMPVLLDAYDDAGRVLFWNRECERVTGYLGAEVMGNPATIAAIYQDEASRGRLHQADDGEPFEVTLRARDGSLRTVVRRTMSGRVPIPGWSAWGIGVDITERKRAEAERERLEEKLLQTQKLESLGVLAGGIAHDFNNLLTAVLGRADLALLDLAPGDPSREHVEQIERSARHAAELTRQLLAYSGRGRFVVEAVELSRMISEMTDLLELSISKRGRLHLHLSPSLPPTEGDAAQLRQVVMNLVTNGAEAVGEHDGQITVTTGVRHVDRATLAECLPDEGQGEGDYVFVEVRDTGHGMTPEVRERIFDPFFTTKFMGRGLGLAAVLGVVRSHRGAIHAQSVNGNGAVFTVFLPVAQPRLAAAAPAPVPSGRRSWRAQGLVLVVDDEAVVRETASNMLRRVGLEPLPAASGQEAIDLLRQRGDAVSLVLLDMTMPGMSGAETLEELRRVRPDVKVLLSSGYSDVEVERHFGGKVVQGFLQKPYELSTLIERLRPIYDRQAS